MLIGDWSAESGWRLGTLLARMEEVTAIFAASDDMAFGILRAWLTEADVYPRMCRWSAPTMCRWLLLPRLH
ncbi:transcriptional regulator [Cutibacterium acnes JCM 18909]|nr:transcriptional regulator [Cutibacterium acnes JCM 18909]